MSAQISFSKLFTYHVGDPSQRLRLSELADEGEHIHGLFELAIAGRALPRMGFFGPDDVCFNTWIEELLRATQALAASEVSVYTFDEGEQGQPAFVFNREGETLYVSVVDSALSGAAGDASYQNIDCSWDEFRSAVTVFASNFHDMLRHECPLVAEEWWSRRKPG